MDNNLSSTKFFLDAMGIKGFEPSIEKSEIWINWVTNFGPTTCKFCAEQNGKVFEKHTPIENGPPVHERCKCLIKELFLILAGSATINGENGADYYLKVKGILPKNYIIKKTAEKAGWISWKGNLRDVLPDAIIGGNIYSNREGKLPDVWGRIWYEADINYTGGYRNTHRILYSNDGLIFVTYDHYETFYEIK